MRGICAGKKKYFSPLTNIFLWDNNLVCGKVLKRRKDQIIKKHLDVSNRNYFIFNREKDEKEVMKRRSFLLIRVLMSMKFCPVYVISNASDR